MENIPGGDSVRCPAPEQRAMRRPLEIRDAYQAITALHQDAVAAGAPSLILQANAILAALGWVLDLPGEQTKLLSAIIAEKRGV